MKSQSSRSLVYIAVFQILSSVLGVLGDKIAEWIQIPVIWLFGITLVVLAAVILIDFYREHRKEFKTRRSKSRNSSLRKSHVRLGIAFLRYYPLAILLSGGTIFLAYNMEPKVTHFVSWWVIAIPIVMTIMFYPMYIRREQIIGHKLKYMRVAAILAFLYGGLGMGSLYVSDILSSKIGFVIYAVFSNIVNFGLNIAYIFYITDTIITPWYNRLPE